MKYLSIILIILFCSLTSQAEIYDDVNSNFNANSNISEDEIIDIARSKSYPGGYDEDELKVQKNVINMLPHITTATLEWRAKKSLSRNAISEEESSGEQ